MWCFCTFLLFSVQPTWSHDKNVDCPHLYSHVIMGLCTLIVGVLKYFLIFGGFVCFDSDPLGLSSYGAFVHFCCSLSAHVIAWQDCWLSTPIQSCDHGIVHIDCWGIKIFSHFGGFCPLWFWSFWAFILWCFCPILLFSVRPRYRMTRMLIIHTCIMLIMGLYTLVAGVLKYFLILGGFVRFDSDPLGHSSYGAFVNFCFSLSAHVIALTRMLFIHTCIMWSWDRTPSLLGY